MRQVYGEDEWMKSDRLERQKEKERRQHEAERMALKLKGKNAPESQESKLQESKALPGNGDHKKLQKETVDVTRRLLEKEQHVEETRMKGIRSELAQLEARVLLTQQKEMRKVLVDEVKKAKIKVASDEHLLEMVRAHPATAHAKTEKLVAAIANATDPTVPTFNLTTETGNEQPSIKQRTPSKRKSSSKGVDINLQTEIAGVLNQHLQFGSIPAKANILLKNTVKRFKQVLQPDVKRQLVGLGNDLLETLEEGEWGVQARAMAPKADKNADELDGEDLDAVSLASGLLGEDSDEEADQKKKETPTERKERMRKLWKRTIPQIVFAIRFGLAIKELRPQSADEKRELSIHYKMKKRQQRSHDQQVAHVKKIVSLLMESYKEIHYVQSAIKRNVHGLGNVTKLQQVLLRAQIAFGKAIYLIVISVVTQGMGEESGEGEDQTKEEGGEG
jgi:hypothetical protein